MRRYRLCWMLGAALLTGVAVGAACDESTGPGDDGQITLDEFDQAYVAALCAVAVRCPAMGGDDMFFMTGGSTSQAACESRMRQALTLAPISPGDMYQDAVDRGSGSWNASLAADCFELMQAASCDDFQNGSVDVEHGECAQIFAGNVPVASACYRDLECANGWCDTNAACPGTCIAYVAPGGACGAPGGGRCGPGYECGDAATCVAETVDPLLSEGQACGSVESECRYGLYCDDGTESCRAYLAENATCGEGTADCTPGTLCDPTALRCTRLQLATTAGAACGESSTTRCDTLANLYCDRATSRCVTLPGNGSPCYEIGGMFSVCGIGSYCGADDVCHTKLADGAPCESDSWCESGECVGTCRPTSQSCDSGDLF